MAAPPVPMSAGKDTSVRSLLRRLEALRPDTDRYGTAGPGPSLEVGSPPTDLPRLISAVVIEGRALRVRTVPADGGACFAGFLDGTQESRVVQYLDGFPIIHGRVGAVIRVRKNRRLATWRHEVQNRVYAPLRLLSP